MQQTMGVVSEKTDKELKLKVTEIEVTKEKLSQIKLVSLKETEILHPYLYDFDVSQEKRRSWWKKRLRKGTVLSCVQRYASFFVACS